MVKPLLPNLVPQRCDAPAPQQADTNTSLAEAGDLLVAVFTGPRRLATVAYNAGCKRLGWEAQESQAEQHTVFELWSAQRNASGLTPPLPAPAAVGPAAAAAHSLPPTPTKPASEAGSDSSHVSSTHQHPGSPDTVLATTTQGLSKVAQEVRRRLLGSPSAQSAPSEAASESVHSVEAPSAQSAPSEAASDSVDSAEGSVDSHPMVAAPAAAQPAAAPAKPQKTQGRKQEHPAARFVLRAAAGLLPIAAAASLAGVAARRHRRRRSKGQALPLAA